MKKKALASVSFETTELLSELKNQVKRTRELSHIDKINKESPYSETINKAITNYNELCLYNELQLKEAIVTRRALIREIDMDMWISHEQKTNRQLMHDGRAPYAYNAKDGLIQLHHIGQNYDAPIAELTEKEHKLYGNSRLLHNLDINSWRRDDSKDKAFLREKSKYWKMRAQKTIEMVKIKPFKEMEQYDYLSPNELTRQIISTIETLLSECSVDDLNYIKDLANSYSLIKQIGVNSLQEFIELEQTRPIKCTYCDSQQYVACGSYESNGERIQRYRCKKCGKSFTKTNQSIISGSNLAFIDWLKLLDCLFNRFSVEKTAEICQISPQTVIANRYKIFYALKHLDDNVKLCGNIVIDETFIELSFKGNHGEKSGFQIPRKPHKRGKESHAPGASKCKISIICALDDSGNSVARVSGLGGASSKKVHNAIMDAIDRDNVECIYSDKSSVLKKFATDNELNIRQGKLIKKGNKRQSRLTPENFKINMYLQKMNSYHSRLKTYLRDFSAPSGKYLSGYLYLFAWKERNKYKDNKDVYKELISMLIQPNQYISAEEILTGRYLPNPHHIEEHLKAPNFKNIDKVKKICDLYAAGYTQIQISKEVHMSQQGVAKYLSKCREIGILPERLKDKNPEDSEQSLRIKEFKSLKYHFEIYEARINWTKSMPEFYTEMNKKHGLSERTIRNIICIVKRILALRKDFSFIEDYPYHDLHNIYSEINSRYLVLCKVFNKTKSCKILAEEFNYDFHNIVRIVNIMKQPTFYFAKDKRLSPHETLNRDRSLFIDYLKWMGTKKSFLEHAAQKYNLSANYINHIIHCVIVADPRKEELID